MATNAAFFVEQDGSLSATSELREELALKPGTRLELVHHSATEVSFRIPKEMREIRSWRDLQGILADSDFDPNAQLELERQRENSEQ